MSVVGTEVLSLQFLAQSSSMNYDTLLSVQPVLTEVTVDFLDCLYISVSVCMYLCVLER